MSTYIIAEMAWSHNGNLARAKELAEGAAKAGADAISIHITNLETYMVPDYKCLSGTTLSDSAETNISIYDYLAKINLTKTDWIAFNDYLKTLELDLVVMANDQESFKFSKMLSPKKYVISAASFLEDELVEQIVKENSDVILRSGGATIEELDSMLDKLNRFDHQFRACVLMGIQLYPTPINQLNLSSMKTLRDRYKSKNISFGLADHIDGDHPYAIHLPAISLAYGANVIEKHITTTREEKLEDYEAALGISSFKTFVGYIRTCEQAIGDGTLNYMADNDDYKKYREVSRKKIVAACEMPVGTVLKREFLTFMRSDYGAELSEVENIIGKKTVRSKTLHEQISVEDVI